MKKTLLLLSLTSLVGLQLSGQQQVLERYIQPTGGSLTDTLDNGTVVTLELSTDDVEQQNDEVDSYYDDDLDAGWEGAPEDQNLLTLGLRFTNITIPQGAVIDSAFIVLHAHEAKAAEDVCLLTIAGEASANALSFDEANFNENFLLTDRPQTSTQVPWVIDVPYTIWQPYSSPNVAAIVQELVNQPNWQAGNAMAFFLLPTDEQGPSTVENHREFTSFENIADPDDVDPQGNPGDGTNHPERRPYLQVYYQGVLGVAQAQPTLFNLSPNPSRDGLVRLQLSSPGYAHVRLYSITGSEVRSFTLAGSTHLDLSDLPGGLYLLSVAQAGEQRVQRLVIR